MSLVGGPVEAHKDVPLAAEGQVWTKNVVPQHGGGWGAWGWYDPAESVSSTNVGGRGGEGSKQGRELIPRTDLAILHADDPCNGFLEEHVCYQ